MRTRTAFRGASIVWLAATAGCFDSAPDVEADPTSQEDSSSTGSTDPSVGPSSTSSTSSASSASSTTGLSTTGPTGETSGASTTSTGSNTETGDGETDTSGAEEQGTSTGPEDDGTSTGECVGAGCECIGDDDCDDGLRCTEDVCAAPACGDGTLDAGSEECDDGNRSDGDGCQNDCSVTDFTVHAGFWSTCLLIEGGRVRCWGRNSFGQLGYGHTDDLGLAVHPWQIPEVALPAPAVEISIGERFSCARIGMGDDVVCWGAGFDGMLGTGNEDDQTDPSMLPPISLGPAGAAGIGTGERHSCSIDNNGDTRCWGRANQGALGYGNENDIGDNEEPVSAGVVSGGSSAIALGVGSEHTCVVLGGGTIRCWGDNVRGQTGVQLIGDVGDDELPSNFSAIDFGTPAVKVVAGDIHTCALLLGGSVQCWGSGNLGRIGRGDGTTEHIGDNETVTSVSPVALGGVAVDLQAGHSHTCALLEGGDLVCWGSNNYGQLGTGDTEIVGDDETPASVGAINLPSPVVQMAVGGEHTCAVLEDRRMFCWGRNSVGQLGLAVNEGSVLAPLMALPVQVFEPPQ